MTHEQQHLPRLAMTVLVVSACWISIGSSRAADLEADDEFARAYPDADVLVLLDRTEMDLEYDARHDGIDGELTREIHYWIRTRHGVDEVNRQPLASSPRFEARRFEVEVRSADGDRHGYDRGDLQWNPLSDADNGVYSLDRELAYAVIPRVGPGDLVRIVTRHDLEDLHGIPSASLGAQAGMPVRRSELVVRYAKRHRLVFDFAGPAALRDALIVTHDEEKRRLVVSLGQTGPRPYEVFGARMPADRVEFAGQFADVGRELGETAFAAGEDWARVGRGYASRVASSFEAPEALAAEARQVVEGIEDPRLRIDRLYAHVQNECRYLGLFDGLGGILPEPAAVTSERRYGDCKGLSTLLIAMLRAVGIDAHPVLVRTRSVGPLVTSVPNMAQFNHFIVWADDGAEGLWLDPTYDRCPAGLVPARNAAWPVLLLAPERWGLVEIPTKLADPGSVVLEFEGALGEDGRLDGWLVERAAAGSALRRRLAADGDSGVDRLAGSLLSRPLLTGSITHSWIETAWTEPTLLEIELTGSRAATRSGSRLYLSRALFEPYTPTLDVEGRRTPVDLRLMADRRESWSVTLPRGASLVADSVAVAAPGIFAHVRSWQEGDRLHVRNEVGWAHEILEFDQLQEFSRALAELEQFLQGHLVIELESP